METESKERTIGSINSSFVLQRCSWSGAYIKSDIESLVSHLKFYLLFTLCSLIDFYAEKAQDFNFDGQITLDDYFDLRELKFDNLTIDDKSIDVNQLKKFKNPIEFIS